jgi:hypothetical protein
MKFSYVILLCREKSELAQTGLTQNWDSRGYGLKFYTDSKYGEMCLATELYSIAFKGSTTHFK